MKRVITIFLILSTFLMLYSCQTSDIEDIPSSAEEDATSAEEFATCEEDNVTEKESETLSISPKELYNWHWTNDSYTYINGEATPWIGDEEEYQVFLQCFKNMLPEKFIKYDQLSELGKFGDMVILSNDGSIYTYDINDDDPQYAQYDYGVYNIYFRITCLSKEDSHNILDYWSEKAQAKIHHETGELGNMATSSYDISELHHVKYHNVIYSYDQHGELFYMDMIIDDYRIHFSRGNQKIGKEYIDCYFKDYAPAEPNFITLLLEGAEYEEVANSFRQMIATETE